MTVEAAARRRRRQATDRVVVAAKHGGIMRTRNTRDLFAPTAAESMVGKNTGRRNRPSHDEIARLAYERYTSRGRLDGHDVEDWLTAERQLTRHYR